MSDALAGSASPERGWTPEGDAAARALAGPIERLRGALAAGLPVRPDRVERWLLNGIVEVLGAQLAFTCRGHDSRWLVQAYSRVADDQELERLAGTALTRLDGVVRGGGDHAGGWHALTQDGTDTVAVRLTPGPHGLWLFLIGDRMPRAALGEPLGVVCRAVLASHDAAREPDPLLAQAAAWDALRRHTGVVPAEMYLARRRAFREQLAGIVPVYAPVLCLHRDTPGIDGWEALALTGGAGGVAATEIHTAAQLWGREFMQLLDQRMLHVAVRDYLVQIGDAPGRVGGGLPLPLGLTVNVSPDTLFADEYLHQVQDLVGGPGGIRAAELALEVSGALGLSRLPPGEVGGTTATRALLDRLATYHEGLGIGLVIDDLGAGAANLELVPDAGLTYAKLDPWIANQPDTRLTAGVIASALASPRIGPGRLVVEGFDDRPPFRLEDAFALGVRFVQGPFVGDPSRELRMELAPGQSARILRAADRARLATADHAAVPRRPGFGRVG